MKSRLGMILCDLKSMLLRRREPEGYIKAFDDRLSTGRAYYSIGKPSDR